MTRHSDMSRVSDEVLEALKERTVQRLKDLKRQIKATEGTSTQGVFIRARIHARHRLKKYHSEMRQRGLPFVVNGEER